MADKGKKPGMDYKGSQGQLVMMGKHERVSGWRGELYVAMIQYGDKKSQKYDVVADSTNSEDVEYLPAVQTFEDKGEAMNAFFSLEHNKSKWR